MLRGAEPREILEEIIEKKTPAIMSYLAGGKWHVAKVQLTELGANRLDVQVLPGKRPQPVDIRLDQPVDISLKYGYGKFIFDTSVTALMPSPGSTGGGMIELAVPDRIEVVERRSYFRVNVPRTLKVSVMVPSPATLAGKMKSSFFPAPSRLGSIITVIVFAAYGTASRLTSILSEVGPASGGPAGGPASNCS